MIQYIYFVKCPECEDEPFDFFDDAKGYALGCLSKKPIITQTEVNRNDFGECTDSADLGTIWSWEDMMNDVSVDSEQTTLSKVDTIECDNCFDPEFDNLNNSLEPITEETEDCTLGFYDRETDDQVLVSFYSFADADEYVASHEGARDLYTDPKYTSENYLKHIGKYRKPIPEEMTIEQLVEEMEENEDTVECVCCSELYPKEECHHDEKHGWICLDCKDEVVECTWCEELYDRSMCRYEVDLGWLCDRCEAAIKSRGETLTFREGNYQDFLDESTKSDLLDNHDLDHHEECIDPKSMVEELEDADSYNKRLQFCPECGATSFDHDTMICINCGLDLN